MKKTLLLLCGATACSAQSLAERDSHVPTLTKAFCADVSQYLAVDGVPSPQQQSNFTLCLDAENLRWNRAMDDGSSIDIFNGTDLWHLVADTSLPGGWNCSHKVSGPDKPSAMPYTMVQMDTGVDLNKTESLDGEKAVQNWYHFRPAKHVGVFSVPAEQMHWHVSPRTELGGEGHALLRSECIQPSRGTPGAPLQHGIRDFSRRRTKFSERTVPEGVRCSEVPTAGGYTISLSLPGFGDR